MGNDWNWELAEENQRQYEEDTKRPLLGKEAVKFDDTKTMLALLPGDVLAETAKRLTYAAVDKYTADNWRTGKGLTYRQCISAAMRHILAFSDGEDIDDDPRMRGTSHLAGALAMLTFLEWYRLHPGIGVDDRWKPPASDESTT